SSTPSCWSASPWCPSSGARSASPTSSQHSSSAAGSSGSPWRWRTGRPRGGRRCSSIRRSSTSRCCSWRRRSTRCSDAGSRDRAQEPALGLGALRPLPADLRGNGRRRVHLPRGRLSGDWPGIFLARPEKPADGVSLAVKDLFDTAGLTTTYGSAIFAEHVPTRTAEAVRLLEEAGYADVGKTNLHEFAYGTTSENPHFGTVPNPVAPGRVAGGSSGGSAAALAAGLADAALGTDTGGSIRIPAACCGVVGFKPT